MKINKAKLGRLFIWLGVSVWGVYGYLLVNGLEPSLFIFLPIHLAFVLTGVRIRKISNAEEKSARNPRIKQVSNVLLIIGVAAWLPFFYLQYFYQLDVGHLPFLVLHLTGMLGGGFLKLF